MKRVVQRIGWLAYWCGWPFFFVYFRLGYGRTRVVLYNRAGELLVMKNWISDGRWSLPGGGLHRGEDKTAAAIRELREETGLHYTEAQLTYAGSTTYRSHGLTYDMHVYHAALTNGSPHFRWWEIADAAWVQPAELNNANAGPDVFASLQMLQ